MKTSLIVALWKLVHLVETTADYDTDSDGDSGCPDGWTVNPENSRCYFLSEQYAKFEIADKSCKTMSSSLASILSFDEHLFILPLIFMQREKCTSFDDCLNYWIGLRNVNSVCMNLHTWMWIDESPMSYNMMFWGTELPSGTHRCGSLRILSDPIDMHGFWRDETCDFPMRYICKKEAVKSCPVGFTFMPDSNSCYLLLPETMNWPKASEACQSISRNTHLAIIRNAADNFTATIYLEQELKGNKMVCPTLKFDGIWLAAQRKDISRCDVPFVWKTSEGRDIGLNFTNWDVGQPDCFNGGEKCLHIKPVFSFKWNDLPCGELSCVLCQRIL